MATAPRPVTVKLTTDRLLALAHYAFQPDRAWEAPRVAMRDVSVRNGAVAITHRDGHGETSALSVGEWTGGYVGTIAAE